MVCRLSLKPIDHCLGLIQKHNPNSTAQYRICEETSDALCLVTAGASISICSVGHVRTYKVIHGLHYDADAKITVLELKYYILFPAKGIMNYRQIISSHVYVHINQV